MSLTLRAGAIQLVLAVVVFGAWTTVTQTHAVNPLLLPPLPAIGAGIVRIAASGALGRAALVTALTVVEAYAVAVVAGIAVGFFVGRSPVATRAFEPLLAAIFAIPMVLFFPLFTVYFGIGPASKVAFGALYGFFPVALNTIAGFASVDPLLLRAVRAQGASRWQMFRHLYLPAALPVVVTGLRIGFFICFASVLGGETLSSAAGVGYAIHHAGELLESAQMYAWIAFVLAATLVLNLAVNLAEARARR